MVSAGTEACRDSAHQALYATREVDHTFVARVKDQTTLSPIPILLMIRSLSECIGKKDRA